MEAHFFAGLHKYIFDSRSTRKDDDFSDRFTHFATSLVLIIFTLVISARQYIGQPIACWVPTEFTKAQEEFAESVCWVSNTYTVLRTVPENVQQREAAMIRYYQWMPFLLMLQMLFCLLPCIVWRFLTWHSGTRLSSVLDVACNIQLFQSPATRESTVAYIARHIEEALLTKQLYQYKSQQTLHHQNDQRQSCMEKCSACFAAICHRMSHLMCCLSCTNTGYFLLVTYLLCKVLYVANALGQFYLMQYFLGAPHIFYGYNLLVELFHGCHWEESGHFPRVTMCDFEVHKLANKHRYTVQCSLPINMLNEKIYIFLWFWMVIVLVLSSGSLVIWFMSSCCPWRRVAFVKRFLQLRGCIPLHTVSPRSSTLVTDPPAISSLPKSHHNRVKELKPRLKTFVLRYLQHDGVFILRLIAHNAGELMAADIAVQMWLNYLKRIRDGVLFHTGGSSSLESHRRQRGRHNSREHKLGDTDHIRLPPAVMRVANSHTNSNSGNRATSPISECDDAIV